MVHVPAGPPVPIAKDDLAPYLDEFHRYLRAAWIDHRCSLLRRAMTGLMPAARTDLCQGR